MKLRLACYHVGSNSLVKAFGPFPQAFCHVMYYTLVSVTIRDATFLEIFGILEMNWQKWSHDG